MHTWLMSAPIKRQKRASSASSAAAASGVKSQLLASPDSTMPARRLTPAIGLGELDGSYEEMGMGREARAKRFSRESSSSSSDALHDDNGFLLPVTGTVRSHNSPIKVAS